ncbi:hypothetical protein BSL78_24012 [Apostichopus japonicus]|uniref:Uncharacterized protein n=1 Tax=Stichopus japonicus TaxID=307972 RepID=A0A2G8JTS4_STIJA|nr:hypothetical protein BSL78_24012 [Apostichopus japonicus]
MAFKKAGEQMSLEAEARKTQYDKKAKSHPITLGTRVYLKNHPRGMHKIADEWGSTVFKVVSRPNAGSVYVIEPADGSGGQRTVHRREIRTCPQLIDVPVAVFKPVAPAQCDRERESSSDSSSDEDYGFRRRFEGALTRRKQSTSDDSDSWSDDSEVTQPLRRSARVTRGFHSNISHLPRSISSVTNSTLYDSKLSDLCRQTQNLLERVKRC